jgi:site-specific recombinase XerD
VRHLAIFDTGIDTGGFLDQPCQRREGLADDLAPWLGPSPSARNNLPWLFVSERGQLMTRQAVNYIVRLVGEKANLGRVWPHMLRHSCGYYLADQGTDLRTMQDYLGHRDPKHTAHYTRVAGHRFEGLWK